MAADISSTRIIESDTTNLAVCREICEKMAITISRQIILINIVTQRMHLFEEEKWACSYPISSAAAGTGQIDSTGKTPLGLHRIIRKIGEGAHPFAIFESRENTGKIATVEEETSHIVGRILQLIGEQEGYNRGRDASGRIVDSYERYIYIHGTSHPATIGRPASHGCIRMIPKDIVDLFDRVIEGDLVYIYA